MAPRPTSAERGNWLASGLLVGAIASGALWLGSAGSDPLALLTVRAAKSEPQLRPLPTGAAIRGRRFVRTVGLDNQSLTVSAPGEDQRPARSTKSGWKLAYSAVDLSHGGVTVLPQSQEVFAFGLVSIRGSLERSLPSRDRFHDRPAWVAIGLEGVAHCPAEIGSPSPPQLSPRQESDSGYVVVIVGPGKGEVVSYFSRTSTCGQPYTGPTVALDQQLLSVAWQPISATSTTAAYTMPPCGQWQDSQATGSATQLELEIEVSAPYDRAGCPPAHPATLPGALQLGVSEGHAPTGPVFSPTAAGRPPGLPANSRKAPGAQPGVFS